jgi:hypothetical protein
MEGKVSIKDLTGLTKLANETVAPLVESYLNGVSEQSENVAAIHTVNEYIQKILEKIGKRQDENPLPRMDD